LVFPGVDGVFLKIDTPVMRVVTTEKKRNLLLQHGPSHDHLKTIIVSDFRPFWEDLSFFWRVLRWQLQSGAPKLYISRLHLAHFPAEIQQALWSYFNPQNPGAK
jgi:hypothetical protein